MAFQRLEILRCPIRPQMFNRTIKFRSSGFSVARPGFGGFTWLVEGPDSLPPGPEEVRLGLRDGHLLADDYDALRGNSWGKKGRRRGARTPFGTARDLMPTAPPPGLVGFPPTENPEDPKIEESR